MFIDWFRRPAARISRKRSGSLERERRLRLILERLEDRTLPSLSPVAPYEVSAISHSPALARNPYHELAPDVARPLAATTTALSSSPNPAVFGQNATFVASVSGSGGTPTGVITFLDGSATLGTGALNASAQASLSTSTLSVGTHSILGVYSGAGNFTGSTSSTFLETVNQDAATAVVVSSPNPATYSQSVAFTITIGAASPGAGTPTGIVSLLFAIRGGLGQATLNSSGQATIVTSTLAPGTYTLQASYQGDANFAAVYSPYITETILKDSTTTTITSSANPSSSGQAVTFIATVNANAPGSGIPTGNVAFMDDGIGIGGATLSGGSAIFVTSNLSAGVQSITAVYGGSAGFASSAAPVLDQTVLAQTMGPATTTTTLTSSADPSVFGQPLTFTATVSSTSPGTPTGAVTFLDGAITLGAAALNAGDLATLTTAGFPVGQQTITAVYGGDANFAISAGAVIQSVTPDSSSTTLTSSTGSSAVFGQLITFSMTVSAASPGSGTPTGTASANYTLRGGLGTVALDSSGQATISTSTLALGNYTLEAVYSGDANFTASQSSLLTITVLKDSTSTAIMSSVDPSNVGQAVTFTATVTANAPGAGTPAGSVEFLDNGTSIGTVALNGGSASFTTSSLAYGIQSITAIYGGSPDFTNSLSSTLTQTVISNAMTLTVTTTADDNDGGTLSNPDGPDGTLSLREAIEVANLYPGGPVIINFAIGNGTEAIALTSALPTISRAVTIDATPPSNLPNQEIVLESSSTSLHINGLVIGSNGSIVNGDDHLAIISFSSSGEAGIGLQGNQNQVEGTFLGTDSNSTTGEGNAVGVRLMGSSNTVGGTTAASRDVISGNTSFGIYGAGAGFGGAGAGVDDVIEGDYIGTNSAGTAALPNVQDGIFLEQGSNNTIGGTTAGAANLISGNTGYGIAIGAIIGGNSAGNVIEGDYIGTNAAGTGALPNNAGGMVLESSNDTIGGTAAGAGDVISGNTGYGITGSPGSYVGMVIEGDYIGTNGAGTAALPNVQGGVILEGASNSTIGGTAAGAANIISGNGGAGLEIGAVTGSASSDLVQGNYIGTNKAGAALGNALYGLVIEGSNNTIGGTSLAASNVINSNGYGGNGFHNDGISIISGNGNLIEGNYIGTDSTGNLAMGNAGNGISVFGGSNTIGGLVAGARNIISGNVSAGIVMENSSAAGNLVEGNYIGTNRAGNSALGNGGAGVLIENGSTGNHIGASGGANLVSGNKGDGIDIQASGNTVAYNVIGANITGTASLGNGGSGVEIAGNSNVIGGSYNSTSGTVSSGQNIIAFNGAMGVVVDSGTGNTILIDSIFSNAGLGIDLLKGANSGIAAPSLTGVTTSGNTSTITGTVSGTANSVYLIEVFLNTNSPAGQISLGYVQVQTNASGTASFSLQTTDTLSAGETLSATATDPAGNTSEFSGTIPA